MNTPVTNPSWPINTAPIPLPISRNDASSPPYFILNISSPLDSCMIFSVGLICVHWELSTQLFPTELWELYCLVGCRVGSTWYSPAGSEHFSHQSILQFPCDPSISLVREWGPSRMFPVIPFMTAKQWKPHSGQVKMCIVGSTEQRCL